MSNLEKLYEEMVVPQKKETTMEFKRVPKNLEEDSKLTPRKTELDEKFRGYEISKNAYVVDDGNCRYLLSYGTEVAKDDGTLYITSNESDLSVTTKIHISKFAYGKVDYKTVKRYNPSNSKNESIKSSIKKSTLKESEADFFDDFEQDAGMRNDVLEYMLNFFSPEDLLTELVRALGDDTALENFGYIARMNDIPKKSEYESGE